MTITQAELKKIFDYKDGALYRKPKNVSRLDKNGYEKITINGRSYLVHRLIFLFHHGYLPTVVDHINRVRNDNRIENLRAATQQDNVRNSKMNSKNTSGYPGVWHNKKTNKWIAYINIDLVRKHIGAFNTFEEAKEARIAYEKKHVKQFQNK
jgi:hypothetical protein